MANSVDIVDVGDVGGKSTSVDAIDGAQLDVRGLRGIVTYPCCFIKMGAYKIGAG